MYEELFTDNLMSVEIVWHRQCWNNWQSADNLTSYLNATLTAACWALVLTVLIGLGCIYSLNECETVPASSTTEFRPSRSQADPSSWSVDDVARYFTETDAALMPYADLFRKHVSTWSVCHLLLDILNITFHVVSSVSSTLLCMFAITFYAKLIYSDMNGSSFYCKSQQKLLSKVQAISSF